MSNITRGVRESTEMLYRWAQRLHSSLKSVGSPTRAAQLPRQIMAARTETLPPQRLYRLTRWRGGLRSWLNTGWEPSTPEAALAPPAPPAAPPLPAGLAPSAPAERERDHIWLSSILQSFDAALLDIDTSEAQGLRERLATARSPRELWHLRSALYTLMATHHTESVASQRMLSIDAHFDSRSLRVPTPTR